MKGREIMKMKKLIMYVPRWKWFRPPRWRCFYWAYKPLIEPDQLSTLYPTDSRSENTGYYIHNVYPSGDEVDDYEEE